ncbi:response regulator [candidate division KSB1 bacterium]|nr:response regulator [candidate division KSB1 bacterium]
MQNKKRILLVDDDEDFVDINRTILESKYEVDVAFSSQSGLEKFKSGNFDLIILDLMMEDRDAGFSFSYAAKNDPKLKNIPILLLTSTPKVTGFSFDLERDKDWMKVDDFAEKPLGAASLLSKVKKLLNE